MTSEPDPALGAIDESEALTELAFLGEAPRPLGDARLREAPAARPSPLDNAAAIGSVHYGSGGGVREEGALSDDGGVAPRPGEALRPIGELDSASTVRPDTEPTETSVLTDTPPLEAVARETLRPAAAQAPETPPEQIRITPASGVTDAETADGAPPPADALTVVDAAPDEAASAVRQTADQIEIDPADAPNLDVADATGAEDSAIPLDLAASLTDTDGSETLSITIAGVPAGAVLSAGTDNGNGTWTLTADQLTGLTITPPPNSSDDFTLTVTATATEISGETATTVQTLDVEVTGVADAPTLTVVDAAGTEDQAIALNLTSALTDTDGSETLTVTIAGVPTGAVLSAGTNNGDGSWTLTAAQLSGLTITPPANSSTDFALTVTATTTEADGDTATTSHTVNVTVAGDADAPTVLETAPASGSEDAPIGLNLALVLADTDGSESVSITIAGVPTGATLSAGTDNGDGTWTLSPMQVAGLTVTPPADSSDDFTLTVTATATEADGDTATTTHTLNVSVAGDADAPTLTVADASGTEDQAIALNLSSALTDTDGSEALSITIAGVPAGASLSAGTDNGDGTWTLSPAQLAGLTITPPANSSTDFALTVTATATEDDGDTATTTHTLNVAVTGDADTPTLSVVDSSGTEDQAIALNLTSALTDTDGSETLAISIAGVPTGAVLSAGTGNGDGTWTLTAAQLAGLTITPPVDSSDDFTLTVTATATEADGDTATTTHTLTVSVAGDADAPTLTVADASGTEDQAIALNLSSALTDTDGSETLAVTIAGVPTGAVLSAGTNNGDGTWTLTAAQLSGLTITPPANASTDFALTVTATSTEADGDTASTTHTLNVAVTGDADAPTLTVADAAGTEDQAIALNLSSALTDTDGSETLAVTIAGVPAGAVLSAGTDNGDGTWTLTAAQLSGLTITPPANSSTDFALTVTARSTEADGDTATTTHTLNVTVTGDADAPTLTVADAAGTEDQAIALNLSSALTDTDGSETLAVTIAGVPAGAVLSAGTDNGDGTWTLTAAQLSGLTITPPANASTDFALTVTARSTEADGDTATTTHTLNVTVTGDADAPTLTVADASGTEDQGIALNLSSALTDTDGSETLAITIAGVPTGAVLSAGTDNGNGSWTLTAGQLSGLTITPPANSSTDFALTVTARSTEADGDTATTTHTLNVAVSGVADTPTLTHTAPAAGAEDTRINLNLSQALADTDGSETLTLVVSGAPAGVQFFAAASGGAAIGTFDAGSGTWSFTTAQVSAMRAGGVFMRPPSNFSGDIHGMQATLTSTESDNPSSNASISVSFDVSVTAVADAPSVTVSSAHGNEDTAIALNIAQSLTDTDGSESISAITIAGVPAGATLNHGTFDAGANVWRLTTADLSGLTVTPAANSSASMSLTVSVTSAEASNGSTATTARTLSVTVDAVADTPTVTVSAASGSEDTQISLNILPHLSDTDGSESISAVTIAGVPAGATLNHGTFSATTGNWTVAAADLATLKLTPSANSGTDFDLTVTATSHEGSNGSTATSAPVTLHVTVDAVADAPTLTLSTAASGVEDTRIDLGLGATLMDADGSESLSLTIAGATADAQFFTAASGGVPVGTFDSGHGTWTFSAAEVQSMAGNGLFLVAPESFSGDLSLTVTLSTTEAENGSTASTVRSVDVHVEAAADSPLVTVSAASGAEDTAIALDIDVALADTDGSEAISRVTITGVPTGASFLAPDGNGDLRAVGNNLGGGRWVFSVADIDGLRILPPAHSDADFTLGVRATATESSNQDSATSTAVDLVVSVSGVADTPTVSVTDGRGNEDTFIALDIQVVSPDADGSETLTVDIAGVPAGAIFAIGGVPVDAAHDLGAGGDGTHTWRFTSDELAGLQIRPPADSNVDFDLQVSARSIETDGGSTADSLSVQTLHVNVRGVADEAAGLGAGNLTTSGSEDSAIDLGLGALAPADTDGSEQLSVVISGVPAGIRLSILNDAAPPAESHLRLIGDGRWSVAAEHLGDLRITPPDDFNGDASLSVNVVVTENDGDMRVDSRTLVVTVDPEADAPAVSISATAAEDAAGGVPLVIDATPISGESLVGASVSGLPGYATLVFDDGTTRTTLTPDGAGVYQFGPGELDRIEHLRIVVPEDDGRDFSIQITLTTDDGGDQRTTNITQNVVIADVADAPDLAVADVSASANTGIVLPITLTSTDADGSESVSFVISGVPSGAVLSHGLNNGDGTWTLSAGAYQAAQAAGGLTFSVPRVITDGLGDPVTSATLTVHAIATEATGDRDVSVSDSLTVGWTYTTSETARVADAPSFSSAASGTEDQAVDLGLSVTLGDLDGGNESVVLVIDAGSLPTGARLSAGIYNHVSDEWTVASGDIAGLQVIPPADFNGDFTLQGRLVVTETDAGGHANTAISIPVHVDAVTDTAAISADASGSEDTAIALDLAVSAGAAGETVQSVVIDGVPAGATLSAGTDNGDGSWTLAPGDLSGLTLSPPADFSGTIGLTVSATTVDGAAAARVTTQAISVNVASVTDGGVITVVHSATASGAEDSLIALNFVDGNGDQNITVALGDTDGSEQLSIVVSGVPAGAVLNHGRNNGFTDNTHTTTSWTIDRADLADLKIQPPRDFNGHFDLTLTAVTAERDGNSTVETRSITIGVDVSAQADAATITVTAASGVEDSAIALDIDLGLTNVAGADAVSVVIIGNVPTGAVLSAGTDNGDGTWTLAPGDLAGLTITPPADSDADFTLSVTATTGEGSTSAVSGTATLLVSVNAEADAGSLTVSPAVGTEDSAIALDITPHLGDTDGSETIGFITIAGVPDGAVFSIAGSAVGTDLGGGVWRFEPGEIDGLKITPPADLGGVVNLQVSVTTTESSNGDSVTSTPVTLALTITGDADAPTLTVADASGTEDQAIALNLSSALTDTDGSETLAITIAGVPTGAVLSAGTDNGDGTWTLTAAQLSGLTITPPANSSADFSLSVTATSTEADGDTATTTHTLNVTVAGDADAPTLTVADASGTEDQAIALNLSSALTDTDGSETLAITIAGVPTGAVLSAGTNNGDGTWTLTAAQLSGLTITPPANSSADFSLSVTATSTEADGDTATTTHTLNVTVAGDADAPTLTVADASGTEDQAIALNLSSALTDTDGSETLAITVAGVPTGAVLSAGTDNGDGTWTLTAAHLAGLTITPPANSSTDFALTVTATSTEADGDTATTTHTLNVSVAGDADAPTLTVADVAGTEDQAIALNLSSALTDTDGSETLAITIAGVPTGAVLSAGTDNGDGSWTLDHAHLAGLTITPPADSSDDFTLTVTATSTEADGDTATTTHTLNVTVAFDANQDEHGTAIDSTVAGTAGADTLFGGGGDDEVSGQGGDDRLFGGSGADVVDGGDGNDVIHGGDGDDTLSGGLGDDALFGGDGADQFLYQAGDGDDVIQGGQGADTLHLADLGAPGDWTLALDSGDSITASDTDHLVLSNDSAGTVTFADGSTVTFESVERIEW